MVFYTIYKITNKINGKFYIGKHQTINLNDGYMGSGNLIKAAIKKYGKENFTKEILFIFNTEDEMNSMEKTLVTIGEDSYNLCYGGKGGFGHINDGSIKHIERCKSAYEKVKNNPNWGIYTFTKGDPRSQEIQKIASTKANNKRKQDGLTESHKAKISVKQTQNNSMVNRCWCVPTDSTNFNKDKKVFLKEKIPDGWIHITEARELKKRKTNTYGGFWIFNPNTKQNRYCRDVIPDGWFKGRKMEYYQEMCRSDSL